MAIKGTLACIRKCYGITIEAVSETTEREAQINLIEKIMEEGNFNVYHLRHADNDWSKPYAISKVSILVNRYGWFITPDVMDFSKGDEIHLTSSNAKYYDFKYDKRMGKAVMMDDESTYPAAEFDVSVFFDHTGDILESFRYYITKSNEEAGIVIPEILSYNNSARMGDVGVIVSFLSGETKPDYCPDFNAFLCINPSQGFTSTLPMLNFLLCKDKWEYNYDVLLYEGDMDTKEDLKKSLEDYEIIMSGTLLIRSSQKTLMDFLSKEPIDHLNLDFEDFTFMTLNRYNFRYSDRLSTKLISPSRIRSQKTSYEVNLISDLLTFYERRGQ